MLSCFHILAYACLPMYIPRYATYATLHAILHVHEITCPYSGVTRYGCYWPPFGDSARRHLLTFMWSTKPSLVDIHFTLDTPARNLTLWPAN